MNKRKIIDIYSKKEKNIPEKDISEKIQEEITVPTRVEEEIPSSFSSFEKVQKEIEEIFEEETKETKKEEFPVDLTPLKREIKKNYGKKIIYKRVILVGLIGLGIVLFFLSSFLWAKAEINIKRKRSVGEINQEILFDKNIKEINVEKATLPMNLYVFHEKASQTFQSSGFGKDERKATGEVTIYNLTLYPQVLVADTRLETPDGKIFRINSRITIPAGTKEDGNIIPGSISVKVTADQPGPDYNIGPCNESTNCKFKIVGFKGTVKYDQFYAYSDKEMSGGAYGTIPMVTNDDLKNAEKAILEEVSRLIEEGIKNKIPKDLKIIEGAISGFKLTNLQSDAKLGDNRQYFNVSAEGEKIIAAFNENNVKDFIRQFYQKDLKENQSFCDEPEINYSLKEVDFKNGTMKVKITGKYFVCPKISSSEIINLLQGKEVKEIENIIKNRQDIEKIVIKITPKWVKKIPQKMEKISINID